MKKLLLIAMLLCVQLSFSQSLVTSNRQWQNAVNYYGWPPSWSTEIIRFTGDTIIDSMHYMKVQRTFPDFNGWQDYGFIREDINKKVYYRFDTVPDHLLYDYNLNEGDTVTVICFGTGYGEYYYYDLKYTVVLVDSMLIGENFRRRINLASEYSFPEIIENWIDSTGNLGGMLHNNFNLVGGDNYTLACYFENEEVKYSNEMGACNFVTSVPASENKISLQISPNPCSDKLMVTTEGIPGVSVIRLTELTGKIISQRSSSGQVTFETSGLPSGLYFITVITSSGATATEKISVIH